MVGACSPGSRVATTMTDPLPAELSLAAFIALALSLVVRPPSVRLTGLPARELDKTEAPVHLGHSETQAPKFHSVPHHRSIVTKYMLCNPGAAPPPPPDLRPPTTRLSPRMAPLRTAGLGGHILRSITHSLHSSPCRRTSGYSALSTPPCKGKTQFPDP